MNMTQNGVLKKDENDYPVMGGTSSVDNVTIVNSAFDPATRRLLTDNGGASSSLTVTDGVTTVTGVTEIDFTSGATVTDGGGGTADVAIDGGSGSPGGSNLQVQYNNAGSFGGISGVISNGTSIQISSGDLLLEGSSSGGVTLNAPATGGGTLTLPAGTDNVVGAAATQTLTNKTLTSPTVTGATITTSTVNGVTLTTGGATTNFLNANGTYSAPAGTGTVTNVTSANTAFATVANGTTTPAITIVAAPAITSATTTVNTSAATAPSSGQVLTATSGTAATWQTPSGNAANITVGTTTITSGTNFRVLMDNSGVLGEYQTTGTGVVAMNTSPTFITPTLGAASATSINGNTFTTGTYTLTGTAGKTLDFTNTITLSGTDSTTMTFPATSATVAGLGTTQTFTGQDKFNNFIDVNNAVTVTSNAGTVPVTFRLNTFTNSSAATMAITMATASAVDGQMTIVRIYDATGVAETIGWTNTENSTVSVPTTSNGSTTLPLTVGFQFNGATSKWRCIALA